MTNHSNRPRSTLNRILWLIILAGLAVVTILILSSRTPQSTTPPISQLIPSPTAQPITRLVVFGDSLSDMGNVFRATQTAYPPNPPYFQGRYSNGRVWVEYLSDRLQLQPSQITNLAYGGATTGAESSVVPGLLRQVEEFTQTQPQADPQSLFILWAGANDYLQGISNASIPVANLNQAIEQLVTIGAKRFLVANLPDLGTLPATRQTGNATTLNTLTQTHNQNLRRSLKQFAQQQPDLQMAILDANALYREAVTNPTPFQFRNVTAACLANSGICQNPNQFLFWDEIHPTTIAHQLLGEAAFTTLQGVRMAEGQSPSVVIND